jgi:hypothetical protein
MGNVKHAQKKNHDIQKAYCNNMIKNIQLIGNPSLPRISNLQLLL